MFKKFFKQKLFSCRRINL